MQNDAGRVISVIDKIVDKRTKSGSGVDITYGQVYEVSGQECSVYLSGSREIALAYGEIASPTEGFRIPGILIVHAEDNVRVSIDRRGHKWIEDVIPVNFPRLSVDPNNGQILTGDGNSPPSIPFVGSTSVGNFVGACLNLSVPVPTVDGVSLDIPWDTVEWDTDGISELANDGIRVPIGKGGFWKVTSLVSWSPDDESEIRCFIRIEGSGGQTFLEVFEARPPTAVAAPIMMVYGSKTVRVVENTLITSSASFTGVDGDLAPLEDTPDPTMFLMAEFMGPFAPVVVETDSFTANAVLAAPDNNTFSANAVLKKTTSATFTADAVLEGAPPELEIVASGSAVFTGGAGVVLTLSPEPTAGHSILIDIAQRSSANSATPDGARQLTPEYTVPVQNYVVQRWFIPSWPGGDQLAVPSGGANNQTLLWHEFNAQVRESVTDQEILTGDNVNTMTYGTVTVTNLPTLIVGAVTLGTSTSDTVSSITATSPSIETTEAFGSNTVAMHAAYRYETSAGDYAVGGTSVHSGIQRGHVGVVTAFVLDDEADVFLGTTSGGTTNMFDNNDLTFLAITAADFRVWDMGSAVTVDKIMIKWAYGNLVSGSGAAAAFTLYGSNISSSGAWTAVITESDPVATSGNQSYPNDFGHEYILGAPVSYRWWAFDSTAAGTNDIKTLKGFG